MSKTLTWVLPTFIIGAALALVGCGDKPVDNATQASMTGLKGSITIDGSSTVEPISTALAEMFYGKQPNVKTSVKESGTGGGFKKFENGEIDIAGASRPIQKEEADACAKNGIEFIEIPVAYDGLTVVVNKENSLLDDITVAELKKIWEPNSTVKTWADVRAGLPAEKITLFGPGDKSGTFDYFTEAIVGKKRSSRPDYQGSEDDNVLVTGVAGNKWALGYFGYSYYEVNQDKIKALKVDGVAPSSATVLDGTYQPLSRPLFWYINKKAFDRPEVAGLVAFMLENIEQAVSDAKYIALPKEAYAAVKKRVEEKKTGSLFMDVKPGMKIEDLLKAESK